MCKALAMFLAPLVIGCGAGAPGDTPARAMLGDDLGLELEPPIEERSGMTSLDCFAVAPEVEARWYDAAIQLENAASRWNRSYVRGSEDDGCALHLVAAHESCDVGCGGGGVIGVRVDDDSIVSGDACEGQQLLLVDVLTHELGHAFGLEHSEGRDCAMCAHDYCETVVPTKDEIFISQEMR